MQLKNFLCLCAAIFCLCLLPALSEAVFPAVSPAPLADEAPAADEAWLLMLVNRDNPIPEDYATGELVTLRGGQQVDRRILPDLQAMFDAARAEGVNPIVGSGFRTREKQKSLLLGKYQDYLNEGHSKEEAQALALKWVAMPGCSEHEVGFCADINADSGSTSQEVYAWLAKNAWRYGFILRYPEDKTDVTGTIYEPWHYRYVGRAFAQEIYERGLCLEEYLAARSAA